MLWALLDTDGTFKGGVSSDGPPEAGDNPTGWRIQHVERWPQPGERWDEGQNDWVLDAKQKEEHDARQAAVAPDPNAPVSRREMQETLLTMLPQLGITISEEQRRKVLPLAQKK
jgi:hypothetical protein